MLSLFSSTQDSRSLTARIATGSQHSLQDNQELTYNHWADEQAPGNEDSNPSQKDLGCKESGTFSSFLSATSSSPSLNDIAVESRSEDLEIDGAHDCRLDAQQLAHNRWADESTPAADTESMMSWQESVDRQREYAEELQRDAEEALDALELKIRKIDLIEVAPLTARREVQEAERRATHVQKDKQIKELQWRIWELEKMLKSTPPGSPSLTPESTPRRYPSHPSPEQIIQPCPSSLESTPRRYPSSEPPEPTLQPNPTTNERTPGPGPEDRWTSGTEILQSLRSLQKTQGGISAKTTLMMIEKLPPAPEARTPHIYPGTDQDEEEWTQKEEPVMRVLRRASNNDGVLARAQSLGGQSSSRRHPQTRNPKGLNVLEEDHDLVTGEERNRHLKRVLRLYQETFHITTAADFITHETADETNIQRHADDEGDGPDPDDLHFDMTSGPGSVWNREVLYLLLEKLREEEEEDAEIPNRTDAYLMNLLSNRFTAVQRPWKQAQKGETSSGALETTQEVAKRVHASTLAARTDRKRT